MSILSSTNSGRFGLRIPTRNYFYRGSTPLYDTQDYHYISKEKSALINQFVQQNALDTKALYYANEPRGYISSLIWDSQREEYFIDKACKSIC